MVAEASRLELLKELGLTPKKSKEPKPLYYKGTYSNYSSVQCEFISVACDNPKIVRIEINSEFHDIDLNYFREMQYSTSDKSASTTKKTSGFPSNYVIFDLETTGFSPTVDKIIEIGAIKVRDNTIVDTFSCLVNPKILINENIIELTGITNQMVKDAEDINSVIPRFLKFIDKYILVGHNVIFDINFICENAFHCSGCDCITNKSIDTLPLSRELLPHLEKHKLCDLVEYYSIENKNTHRSLDDCYATYDCFKKLKEEAISQYENTNKLIKKFIKPFKHKKTEKDIIRNSPQVNTYNIWKNKSIDSKSLVPETSDMNTEHPLYDKTCVFTGELQDISRLEAMQCVVNFGGKCGNSVTKKTDYLIIGNYDNTVVADKSGKQIKAEKYIDDGFGIKIINETEFHILINA